MQEEKASTDAASVNNQTTKDDITRLMHLSKDSAAQGVYVGGTYPATLTRAAQGTPSYRPPQFAFTTPPVRPLQEEFKSTKSQEEGDGSSTESVKPLPTPRRTFTFEAPMRPLDVARNMYLDYSAVQSIKFYKLSQHERS